MTVYARCRNCGRHEANLEIRNPIEIGMKPCPHCGERELIVVPKDQPQRV